MEATLGFPDVGNITDPDLIDSTDLKVFETIDPWMRPFNGGRRLTDTERLETSFINRATHPR